MKVGRNRQLVIPPRFAYDTRGAGGVISLNATPMLDVKWFAVR